MLKLFSPNIIEHVLQILIDTLTNATDFSRFDSLKLNESIFFFNYRRHTTP